MTHPATLAVAADLATRLAGGQSLDAALDALASTPAADRAASASQAADVLAKVRASTAEALAGLDAASC